MHLACQSRGRSVRADFRQTPLRAIAPCRCVPRSSCLLHRIWAAAWGPRRERVAKTPQLPAVRSQSRPIGRAYCWSWRTIPSAPGDGIMTSLNSLIAERQTAMLGSGLVKPVLLLLVGAVSLGLIGALSTLV
ncbi:hypothetical protein CKO38_01400 [Rhodospirillum rubrum]|nr:hypothetical protein [Rhodospirillum rubrum]MBK1675353.1 hypothetical protein [Rhodospirillum rubrum]